MLDLRIVPDVLTDRPTCTVGAGQSVRAAALRMRDMDVGAAAVVAADGSVLGLITERDLARRLVAEGLDASVTPVSAVMHGATDRLAPGDLAVDAFDLMGIRDVTCLPVIEDDGLAGLVTITDLCAVLRREMEVMLQAAHDAAFQPDADG